MAERSHGRRIIEDENEIREFESDLATEAATDCCDGGGGGPSAVRKSRDDQARAETSGPQESGLQYRYYREAFGFTENFNGDDFVWTKGLVRVDKGGEDFGGFLAFT